MPKLELVRRYDLEGFLQTREGLPRQLATTSASKIWSALVHNTTNEKLPIRLYCTLPRCGKEYGECPHGRKIEVQWGQQWVSYSSRQISNWAFERNSLLQSREIIETEDIWMIGGDRSKQRQHLLNWLDHVKKDYV